MTPGGNASANARTAAAVRASAGKNDSIDSSLAVTSTAVPNVAIGADEGELARVRAEAQRDRDLGSASVGRLAAVAARVAGELLVEGETAPGRR